MIPQAASAEARAVDSLLHTCLVVTGVLAALLLAALMVLSVWKPPRPPAAAWAAGMVGVLLATLGVADLVLVARSHKIARDTVPTGPDVVPIEVLAQRYSWTVLHAGDDGRFATPDDVRETDVLHVPLGRPVVVEARSKDVVHALYFPAFRTQADAIPGRTTRLWFRPDTLGRFEFVCANLCGPAHYLMRGVVEVMEPAAYEAWLRAEGGDARRRNDAGATHDTTGWAFGR